MVYANLYMPDGWLGTLLVPIGIEGAFSKLGIVLVLIFTGFPFVVRTVQPVLEDLDAETEEAAGVLGANRWQTFWEVTFPLMLPVSITAILIRVIFKLKLADIIINITSGGPGGATDSVTSFIYREYRDRSNVGYGTLLAMVYLVIIILFITGLIKFFNRFLQRPM